MPLTVSSVIWVSPTRVDNVPAAVVTSKALAEAARAEVPILFYENEERLSLHDVFSEIGTPLIRPSARTGAPSPEGEGFVTAPVVNLMTGSEGGFSEEEIAQARAAGLKICTLGPRILRCETAPLAGLTATMYALGEL